MNITAIIVAAIVVGCVGIVLGLFLGISGEKFKVEVDPKEEAVLEVLPGNNCGAEALRKIESRDYDLVFMDHMMPEMDGIECFHRIRNKKGMYFKDVPIIALTANAVAGAREMFLSEGFQDFVAKPI